MGPLSLCLGNNCEVHILSVAERFDWLTHTVLCQLPISRITGQVEFGRIIALRHLSGKRVIGSYAYIDSLSVVDCGPNLFHPLNNR